MLPESFTTYYQIRTDNIAENFHLACHRHSIDGFHELRVEIKRLRALFALVKNIAPALKTKKHLRNIRRIFRSAGDVRDCHVQMDLMREYAGQHKIALTDYQRFLKKKESKAFAKFIRRTEGLTAESLRPGYYCLESALRHMSEREVIGNAERHLSATLQWFMDVSPKEDFRPQNLHDIRKTCKETRYILEIIRHSSSPNDAFDELNTLLRSTHRALGQWHDNDVGLLLLQDFLADHIDTVRDSQAEYTTIVEYVNERITSCLDDFKNAWSELLRFLPKHTAFEIK